MKTRPSPGDEVIPKGGGSGKSSFSTIYLKNNGVSLRTLRTLETGGKGREEKLSEGAASRRHLVLPLSVAKKDFPF